MGLKITQTNFIYESQEQQKQSQTMAEVNIYTHFVFPSPLPISHFLSFPLLIFVTVFIYGSYFNFGVFWGEMVELLHLLDEVQIKFLINWGHQVSHSTPAARGSQPWDAGLGWDKQHFVQLKSAASIPYGIFITSSLTGSVSIKPLLAPPWRWLHFMMVARILGASALSKPFGINRDERMLRSN